MQHLSSHFNVFGSIEEATIEYAPKSGKFAQGTVIYKFAADASRALSFKSHQMFGNDLNVIAANSAAQLAASRTTHVDAQPHATSMCCNVAGMQLIELSDDCLCRIFERLSVEDLLSAAETCIRFRDVASAAFRAQHRCFHIGPENGQCHTLRKCLSYFGGLISDLRVSMYNSTSVNRRKMIELILTHCSQNFVSLRLHQFQIEPSNVRLLRLIFKRTTKLTIENCTIDIPPNICLFTHCQSLTKLKISKCNNFNITTLTNVNLPNLHSFSFNDTILEKNESPPVLQQFFQRHTKLTKLSINGYLNNYYTTFPTIGRSCEQLEQLCINAKCDTLEDQPYNELIEPLFALQNVRKLKMQCRNRSPASFMGATQSHATLRHVQFSDGIVDSRLIENLGRFAALCVLCLLDMDNAHLIVTQLSHRLPLAEVVIKGYCDITDDDLVVAVARLKALRRLVLMDTGYQLSEIGYSDIVRTRRRMAFDATLVIRNFETSQKELACSFHGENRRFVQFHPYNKYDNPLLYDTNMRMDDEDDTDS